MISRLHKIRLDSKNIIIYNSQICSRMFMGSSMVIVDPSHLKCNLLYTF